jgi:acyl-CoA hydrolase
MDATVTQDGSGARAQSESLCEMNEYVLPQHANAMGNVFGGQIMAWVDLCAAICAQRHSGLMAVTAFVDDLKFVRPVRIGEVVHLDARVTATFHSSMEIEVNVQGENARTRERWPCVDAFVVFVALGEDGKPAAVPPLRLDSDRTRASQAAGEQRRQTRLSKR